MNGFDKAVEIVFHHEGGYVNDPVDPGGETRFGISKRAYPNENIRTLTRERARFLYFYDFWQPLALHNMPEPVTVLMFDMAVNLGHSAAVKVLQRAVNVQDDGIIGPITLAAVRANFGRDLLGEITAQRILYYTSLGTFYRFGRGWVRRSMQTLLEIA